MDVPEDPELDVGWAVASAGVRCAAWLLLLGGTAALGLRWGLLRGVPGKGGPTRRPPGTHQQQPVAAPSHPPTPHTQAARQPQQGLDAV
jgi:hypothetical protein